MKKKEIRSLTYKENKSYKRQKVCYICEKGFSTDDDESEIIVIKLENIEELLIIFIT